MTAPAPLDDDRAFLTDGRPYLTAAQAALYVGYAPTAGLLARADKQMKAFYMWAASRGVHPQPGRAVYRRSDLDAAITRRPASTGDLEMMRALARDDVAERRRRQARATWRRVDEEPR